MHKKGTIGWINEQKQKKELNKVESEVSKVEIKNEVIRGHEVQCTICDIYFQKEDDLDDDICNNCWPLVNSK